MTNDEAINEIEKLDDWISTHPSLFEDWCKTSDALEMAIKALKIQPCENCISRHDVVDIINGYAEQFNGYIGTPNDSEVYAYARGLLLSIKRNISVLPSVTPTIPDVENNFNIGYNCGYADAMSDVAEGSESE